jgi:hypothetical protein
LGKQPGDSQSSLKIRSLQFAMAEPPSSQREQNPPALFVSIKTFVRDDGDDYRAALIEKAKTFPAEIAF